MSSSLAFWRSLGFIAHLTDALEDAQREYRLAIQLDHEDWLAHRLLGAILGGAALAGMLMPVQVAPGVIFDGRAIPIALAGLFAGPVGAAVAVLMSADEAAKRKITPLGRIVSWATAGVDPEVMGSGPIPASRKALEKAGWKVGDLDLVEAHGQFLAMRDRALTQLHQTTLATLEVVVNANEMMSDADQRTLRVNAACGLPPDHDWLAPKRSNILRFQGSPKS